MTFLNRLSRVLLVAGIGMLASSGFAPAASAATPYNILNTTQTLGTGGIDYVYADNDDRRLYVPRGDQVLVFELELVKANEGIVAKQVTENIYERHMKPLFIG